MYRNILLAIDVDEPGTWHESLPLAVSLTKCASGHLTLCSVLRDLEALDVQRSPMGYREKLAIIRAKLDGVASTVDELDVAVEVGSGTICGGVLEVAERVSADLIVIASHQPGLSDYVVSANAARVARRAPCSVLVVRGQGADIQGNMIDTASPAPV